MKSGEIPALSRNGKGETLSPILPFGFNFSRERSESMFYLTYIFLFLSSFYSFAEDAPIIVSAPSGAKSYLNPLTSVFKLEGDELLSTGKTSVAEALKGIPSLYVTTNGAFGKASTISLRGTSNRHTLIIIDGVRVTDLTGISGGSRLEFLELDYVESIEVLKGSNSVLYGSEAIGGVIKITTKRGEKGSSHLKVEAGSYQNYAATFSRDGSQGNWSYYFSGGVRDVEGISAYGNSASQNLEADGFNMKTFQGKFDYENSHGDKAQLSIGLGDARFEFDDASADNSKNHSEYRSLRLSSFFEKEINNIINPRFSLTTQLIDRKTLIDNSFGRSEYPYKGSFYDLEIFNISKIGKVLILQSGFNTEKEISENLGNVNDLKRERNRWAGFTSVNLIINNLVLEAGGRFDKTQFQGENYLYRIGGAFSFNNLELKAFQSTGFKAPSLYQLFSTFGNTGLLAESSQSQDFSVVYDSKRYSLEITYFTMKLSNSIEYLSGINRYVNLGGLDNKGVETLFGGKWGNTKIQVGGTFSNPIDSSTGRYAFRRPRRKFETRLSHNMPWGLSFGINGLYVGERFETTGERMPSFSTFDLNLSYSTKKWKSSLFLNNIGDKDYQEVRNFQTPGRNLMVSLSCDF